MNSSFAYNNFTLRNSSVLGGTLRKSYNTESRLVSERKEALSFAKKNKKVIYSLYIFTNVNFARMKKYIILTFLSFLISKLKEKRLIYFFCFRKSACNFTSKLGFESLPRRHFSRDFWAYFTKRGANCGFWNCWETDLFLKQIFTVKPV